MQMGIREINPFMPVNTYAVHSLWLIWPIENYAKNLKNDGNPGIWYSSESTQWELSNEYQHDRV